MIRSQARGGGGVAEIEEEDLIWGWAREGRVGARGGEERRLTHELAVGTVLREGAVHQVLQAAVLAGTA